MNNGCGYSEIRMRLPSEEYRTGIIVVDLIAC
jgi:hypothetical protein